MESKKNDILSSSEYVDRFKKYNDEVLFNINNKDSLINTIQDENLEKDFTEILYLIKYNKDLFTTDTRYLINTNLPTNQPTDNHFIKYGFNNLSVLTNESETVIYNFYKKVVFNNGDGTLTVDTLGEYLDKSSIVKYSFDKSFSKLSIIYNTKQKKIISMLPSRISICKNKITYKIDRNYYYLIEDDLGYIYSPLIELINEDGKLYNIDLNSNNGLTEKIFKKYGIKDLNILFSQDNFINKIERDKFRILRLLIEVT